MLCMQKRLFGTCLTLNSYAAVSDTPNVERVSEHQNIWNVHLLMGTCLTWFSNLCWLTWHKCTTGCVYNTFFFVCLFWNEKWKKQANSSLVLFLKFYFLIIDCFLVASTCFSLEIDLSWIQIGTHAHCSTFQYEQSRSTKGSTPRLFYWIFFG